jgi:hypothetical protein
MHPPRRGTSEPAPPNPAAGACLGRLRLLVAAQQRKVGDVDLAKHRAVKHAGQTVRLDHLHVALHAYVKPPLHRKDESDQPGGEGVDQQPARARRACASAPARACAQKPRICACASGAHQKALYDPG